VEVKTFYDRYPYPPPVDDLEPYRRRWQDSQRRRADFHLFWPWRSYCEDYSILIAGCGTSQAAKYAMRWPAAQITAIDFSTASIQHTERLKHRYRLDNLQVRQIALEQVGDLRAKFDQIVCTGVLHHLRDPDAGLRALRSVLAPHGVMHLMLYAPYGRSGIYMLQEFLRRVRFQPPEADINGLVEALKVLPPDHPLARLMHEAADFRTEAALADALLHPQDRAYSVPQLFEFLRANAMRFGRWLRQAPYSFHVGLLSRIPQRLRGAPVSPEDQYAAAELFRGTMVRHSAIVHRDDDPLTSEISFASNSSDWLRYVPIRVPDSLRVEERLPAGMAAVLINRAHTYKDIYLPVLPHEKRLHDAIDGKRMIGELLSGESEREASRALFERLWWHDQVVFDASAAPPGSEAG
jgi:2-polyprenyl-3-methyl-5-hydroxy-6-metoxy-1,4-benzoquinol methylase